MFVAVKGLTIWKPLLYFDGINEILNENTAAWLATKVKPDGYIGGENMQKRMISLAVSILMVIALIPQGAVMVMAQDEQYTTVTKDTHIMTTGTYVVNENVTIAPDKSGNGIQVENGALVFLYIEEGKTLTVTGKDAEGNGVGRAAILLPEGARLTIAGKGTLDATGGKAGAGADGKYAFPSLAHGGDVFVGEGGAGGNGGGGAGAGIGTDGGVGGKGGAGGAQIYANAPKSNVYGNNGNPGSAGSQSAPAGSLFITGSVKVIATGGAGGGGGSRGRSGGYWSERDYFQAASAGTSGAGGGGGGGSAADGIGSGGTGGGGGGGGASANIDGEAAFFGACDLDDLWGYGGFGGLSAWGGSEGARGEYGKTNGGDDTGASKKYAKAGGAGGSCAEPRAVGFFTCKDSDSSNPQVLCTAGHGATRRATPLGTLQEFTDKGDQLVSGWTVEYDGDQHGVSVDGSNKQSAKASAKVLLAQSNTALQAQEDAGDWDEEGQVTLDGVEVSYTIVYYDASGERVGEVPWMPGQYAAVVTFTSDNKDYCGDWVEPFTIARKQVEKPDPRALVFECENWDTGEGAMKEAFLAPDTDDYEFVQDAKAADGTRSLRSAREAGSYQACFRLNDPETCVWAGESDDTEEIWIPWSIALQEFDANDPEITYWGTAYNSNTTTVEYTGKPVWVRPWFTYAKDTDGRYPKWFTHWGDKDRPTTNKLSSAVFYMKGEDDREGLVGYHTKANGDLEKVTAEQVYAWANGVEINGKLISVKSGDKVWYKTDEDGWKIPLAVGKTGPEGAEGYVVARNYAYADKLGVKDLGIYRAYAWFDDGAGFASTSMAEVTVVVKPGISGAEVSGITDKTYTGKELMQPDIKVVLDGKTLAEGTDYKVTYADNTNAGTAKVTISGINEYTGTIDKTFNIAKAEQKVKAVTPKSGKAKKLAIGKSFTIKATASIEQGEAQFKKLSGNRKLKISSTGKVTAKKGLKKGKIYKLKYKVRIKATGNCETTKYVTKTVKIRIKK